MNLFEKAKLFDKMVATLKASDNSVENKENRMRALSNKYEVEKVAQDQSFYNPNASDPRNPVNMPIPQAKPKAPTVRPKSISPDARKALMGLQHPANGPTQNIDDVFKAVTQTFANRSARTPIAPATLTNIMQNLAQQIDSYIAGANDKVAAFSQVSSKIDELKKLPGFSAGLPTLYQSSRTFKGALPNKAPNSQKQKPAPIPAPQKSNAPVASAPNAKQPGLSVEDTHKMLDNSRYSPTGSPADAMWPGWNNTVPTRK